MRAISFMKTAVLAFALTALGGIQTVLADDATSTATITLSSPSNGTVSATCTGDVEIEITEIIGFEGDGRDAYLSGKRDGIINVDNFKYEVSNVTWARWKKLSIWPFSSIPSPSGNTYVTYGQKEETLKEPYNNLKGYDVVQKFLDVTAQFVKSGTTFNGINSFVISNTENTVYTKYIYVTYYEPGINFKGNTPTSLTIGESVNLSEYYEITHNGAFNFTNAEYSVDNTEILDINSSTGKITAKKAGEATVTLTLTDPDPNCTKTISATTKISVVGLSADENIKTYHCHDGNRYDNYESEKDPHDIDDINVEKLNKSEDFTFESANGKHSDPYGSYYAFGKLTSTSSKRYRVGFQTLRRTITIPSYTKLSYHYSFMVETTNNNNNTAIGAELFWTDNESNFENMSLSTDATNSSPSNSYSLCRVASSNTSNAIADKKGEQKASKDPVNFTYYLGLMSFVKRNENENKQFSTFWEDTKEESFTYCATITFHSNTTPEQTATQDITSTVDKYGTASTTNLAYGKTWTNPGYKLVGWTDEAGNHYDLNGAFTAYDSENKCGKGPVDLYAVWELVKVKIHFDTNGGKLKERDEYSVGIYSNTDEVHTLTIAEDLKSMDAVVTGNASNFHLFWGNNLISKSGYTFEGWYTKSGTMVYSTENANNFKCVGGEYWSSSEGIGTPVWIGTEDLTLYAHWTKSTYTIKFDATEGAVNNTSAKYDGTSPEFSESDRYMTITVTSGNTKGNWMDNCIPTKDGYVFDGWYDSNGKKVYSVDDNNTADVKYNSAVTDYWDTEGKWIWTGDDPLILTAHYKAKFTIDGDVITWNENGQVTGEDVTGALNANTETTRVLDLMNTNGEWGKEIRSADIMKAVNALKGGKASQNIIVYINSNQYGVKDNDATYTNVVLDEGGEKTCYNFVVTDKVSMRTKYAFTAKKATYYRETTDNWGTVCLPFPTKNTSTIKYYTLGAVNDASMEFNRISDDATVDTDVPYVYRNLAGGGNLSVEETNITIPVSGPKDAKTTKPLDGWSFVGTRDRCVFYGSKRDYNRTEEGITTHDDNYYFFLNNTFTKMYELNKWGVNAYRGYFINDTKSSSAKAYRIIAFDDEEISTDITNLINCTDSEIKIFDLGGRQIETPIKGHIYIINGKKKLYK